MVKVLKNWFHNGDRSWKITFYTAQCISIILIMTSFFLPPMGSIDSSVFAGIGEMAFFPTLYSFYRIIMSGRSASITKGETTLTVGEMKE